MLYNYLSRTFVPCSPLAVALLEAAGKWTSRASLVPAVSVQGSVDEITRTINALVDAGALEDSDREEPAGKKALSEWEPWNPAAGFFHAIAQSAFTGVAPDESSMKSMLITRSFPNPLKVYQKRKLIELPAPKRLGRELGTVLRRRRTWREFGNTSLALSEISTLLGRTFGIDQWIEVSTNRWMPLKSSPSGGARHSIEAYLMAFNVEGLSKGTYHYSPDAHALTKLRPTSRKVLRTFYKSQKWFHDPAAVIVMTSVFARTRFKYPHPHAYRAVLLDAGHLGQTFALVATALSLAPFCTAAFDTRAVEDHLRIDGIAESSLLLLGVGARPPGKLWAPMPDRTTKANTHAPSWAVRLPLPDFP